MFLIYSTTTQTALLLVLSTLTAVLCDFGGKSLHYLVPLVPDKYKVFLIHEQNCFFVILGVKSTETFAEVVLFEVTELHRGKETTGMEKRVKFTMCVDVWLGDDLSAFARKMQQIRI